MGEQGPGVCVVEGGTTFLRHIRNFWESDSVSLALSFSLNHFPFELLPSV